MIRTGFSSTYKLDCELSRSPCASDRSYVVGITMTCSILQPPRARQLQRSLAGNGDYDY